MPLGNASATIVLEDNYHEEMVGAGNGEEVEIEDIGNDSAINKVIRALEPGCPTIP